MSESGYQEVQQQAQGFPSGPHYSGAAEVYSGNESVEWTGANVEINANEKSNVLRQRDELYRLIVSQLFYDGFTPIAVQLSNVIQAEPACAPSERLLHLYTSATETSKETNNMSKNGNSPDSLYVGEGLDLEFSSESRVPGPEMALYETCYVTSHKDACRAAAFSADGKLCATASVDTSIKLLDVDRMIAKGATPEPPRQYGQRADVNSHPVIRTLYDHVEEVTSLDFHPRELVLASGSRDCTLKFFEFGKMAAKRAARNITDASPINAIAFHPSGDYMVVGCEHPVLRMYDVVTGQCFVGAFPKEQHVDVVTSVKWSVDGKMYASSSMDGSIKLWDGVSSQCVSSFPHAHDGQEVCSVQFSRNGKYVLSSGKDSLVKLWEIATARCIIAYTGAGSSGRQVYRGQGVLNHTEDYVMLADETNNSLCCWDARNAGRKQLLHLGHNGVVRFVVHSPVSPALITCSDDFRARFWCHRSSMTTYST